MTSNTSCRALHKAKCLEELMKHTDIKLDGRPPRLVCNSLSCLYNEGNKYKSCGDEELAYIYYMRWLHCMNWLQKKLISEEDRRYLKTLVNNAQLQNALEIVEKLTVSLQKRYSDQYPEIIVSGVTNNIEKMQIDSDTTNNSVPVIKDEDHPLQLPETPTDDPQNSESDTITCLQLFHEMKRLENKIMIIDLRSSDDFMKSRISSNRCINMPSEHVKTGILANKFTSMVGPDNNAKAIFRNRSNAYHDLIVLLDWCTTQATFKDNNRLFVFKQILLNWDPGVDYKRIALLEGGYKEWLNCFPAITTDPSITPPDLKESNINEILEDIEYPDSLHPDSDGDLLNRPKIKPIPTRSLKPVRTEKNSTAISSNNNPQNLSNGQTNSVYINDTSKLASSNTLKSTVINKTVLPGNIKDNVATENDGEMYNNRTDWIQNRIVKPNDDNVAKPSFDRSVKPNRVKKSDADSDKIIDLLEQNLDVVRNLRSELREKLLLESQLAESRDDTKYNAEQKVQDLQKISSFDTSIEKKKERCKEIKYLLLEFENKGITVKPAYYDKKSQLDLSIGQAEYDLRVTEKRCIEFLKDLKRKQVESTEKNLSTPPREIDHDVHKEPLKQDGPSMNTSLKRSYSSPNLAQMEHKESVSQRFDNAMPRVDRTSKPLQQQQQHRNLSSSFTNKHPLRRDREQRMSPIFGNMHPGITGLKNLGNSCYMNSIIQCLSNTTSLARYFIHGQYTEDLNVNNKKMQGHVVEEVAQVIKALWCGHYRSISPRDLKVAIGQYKLQFENYDQQDSHEFLTFLLDWMHNDLKSKQKLEPEDTMSNAEKEWHKAMCGQTSIISQLFFGQLRSSVSCTTCQNSSMTYESFNSLTLSIPDSLRCNLDDCIKKYVSGQRVSDWRCPKCKTARDGTKKFDFIKLAPIIVIHLNRFGDTGGWLEKKNTAVDFPLTSLNLRHYVAHESGTTEIPTNTYSLYAVSNHYGTMDGGHYTAYCKSASQNKWYKYDDHTVTEVSATEVKSQTTSAYLLFYTSVPNSPIMDY